MENEYRNVSSGDETQAATPAAKQKRTRTRTGCLNCRRKRRKCDEGRPSCGACSRRNEDCTWGVKLKFRAENAQSILEDHPSMKGSRRRPSQFEILNVTNEIIRDYHHPSLTPPDSYETEAASGDEESTSRTHSVQTPGVSHEARKGETSPPIPTRQQESPRALRSPPVPREDTQNIRTQHRSDIEPDPGTNYSAASQQFENGTQPSHVTLDSSMNIDSAVVNLLYLSQGQPPIPPLRENPNSATAALASSSSVTAERDIASPLFPEFMDGIITSPAASPEDGIFMPGSTYHELHSTLRTHLLSQVPASAVHKLPAPVAQPPRARPFNPPRPEPDAECGGVAVPSVEYLPDEHESPAFSRSEELRLWRNWITEISPWLDKFDNAKTFQHQLPDISRDHPYLRYSMLALSARQIEVKKASSSAQSSATGSMNRASDRGGDTSLMLYQEAIHLLLPILHTRTTPVIASCVVLCVLEMLSCSPKAWRRHLDGCATLLQAANITGFASGRIERALFWCFARMDVCGGLINNTRTLIPVSRWASTLGDLDGDMGLFRASIGAFDTCANCTVYLAAQVLDLLASRSGLDERQFSSRWIKLWRYLDDWHTRRPPEMYPVMTMPPPQQDPSRPFPTILYSNGCAISGNQLYHTSALLMLQHRPESLRPSTLPSLMHPCHNSSPARRCAILWHARQICAISISNEHHGAWTNSIQPLWVAGRCMSHPSEHRSILELLDRIERECGWATRWRADDLRDFWGDLGDE